MRKDSFRLFGDYLVAHCLGVFWAMLVIGAFVGLGSSNDTFSSIDVFLQKSFGWLFISLVAVVFAPLLVWPASVLGYLVSYAFYQRNMNNVFLWVLSGFLVGALGGFFVNFSVAKILVEALVGSLVAYFMWRRI